jgi:hypothetical protein
MKVGSRVVVTNTDYDIVEGPYLANGQKGTVVELYSSGLVIVNMDNCKDKDRDGWSFFTSQVKEI